MTEWRDGVEGLGVENSDSSCCLTCSGRMLPQPREQQQKRLCPEARLLPLKGALKRNRMELQLRQNLGQLQSPQ